MMIVAACLLALPVRPSAPHSVSLTDDASAWRWRHDSPHALQSEALPGRLWLPLPLHSLFHSIPLPPTPHDSN